MPINKDPYNLIPGELNNIDFNLTDLRIDLENVKDGIQQVKNATRKIYEPDAYQSLPDIVSGICLYVVELYTNPVNTFRINFSLSDLFNSTEQTKKPIYKIYCRVPEIHAHIPMPSKVSEDIESLSENDKLLITMHDVYYSTDSSTSEKPSIGDLILVNRKSNEFLSIKEKNESKSIPFQKRNELPANIAKNKFSNNITPDLLSSISVGDRAQVISEEPPSDLVSAGTATRASSYISGEFGRIIDLVIIDGLPVDRLISQAIIKMKEAADKDGIKIILNSAYRGDEDIDTTKFISSSNKQNKYTGRGRSATGQRTLWEKNCPDGTKNSCSPITAKPGNSRAPHTGGIAIDIQTGMGNLGESPHPSKVTNIYIWLANNAHLYGFIRTIKSERWHWEYRPGEGRFQYIPKDHGSWDYLFIDENVR